MVKFGTHTHLYILNIRVFPFAIYNLQANRYSNVLSLDFPTNLKMELKDYFHFTNGGKSEN